MKRLKKGLALFLTLALFAGLAAPAGIRAQADGSDDGLLLHYDFSGLSGELTAGTQVADLSGNGHTGTVQGNGASAEDGVLTLPGGAADSGAAYVELPSGMFDDQDTLTISLWLKNETGAGNYAAMFFGTRETTPTGYWLLNPRSPMGHYKSVIPDVAAADPFNQEVGISPTIADRGITGPLTGSGWGLYTTVLTPSAGGEPGSLTAYYNGIRIGTVETHRNVSDFGDNLAAYIGKSSYNDPFYKGGVKDVRVYTRALSDEEVAAQFREGTEDRLLLHYDFESVENGVIPDISGSGNDGVIRGQGAVAGNGELYFPGGAAGSDAAYVELPRGMFDNQDTLTISLWLKNETDKGNYAAMYFGTDATSHYWLLNPGTATGMVKSVITKGSFNGEYGFSPTNGANGILGPASSGNYDMYTTVIGPGTMTLYYNGENCGTVSTGVSVHEFGAGLTAYLAKSTYPDMFFKGGIRDLKVYTKALSDAEILDAYYSESGNPQLIQDALDADLAELQAPAARIYEDITLPLRGEHGSSITWTSSQPQYLSLEGGDGKVTRPAAEDEEVELTAVLELGGETRQKVFTVTVMADTPENNFNRAFGEYDLGQSVAFEDIVLPETLGDDIRLAWSSSAPELISAEGKVNRPESGEGNGYAELTVRAESGALSAEKTFEIEVIEKPYGKILTYVREGNTDRTDAMHYAYSPDGETYTALNNNRPVLYRNQRIEKKMGSPVLFRKADGGYGMICSDDNNSTEVVVYDSDDLIYFENPRTLSLNSDQIRVINPQCAYDSASRSYLIRYEGSDGKSYQVSTKDFVSLTEPEEISYTKESVTGALPEGAAEAGVFEATKEEYERIINKWQRVVNTTVSEPGDLVLEKGEEFSEEQLPEKITANYSDGSEKQFGVVWNAEELAAVDTSVPGTYEVTGTLNQPEYSDILVEQRADPWTFLGDDGYYYFTGSYPVKGQEEENQGIGYDRIVLRRSKTIQGLSTAEEATIWEPSEQTGTYRYIWAPEIHQIDGIWYVFFTASIDPYNTYNIRPHVLKCTGGDPMDPNSWELHRMQAVEGDTFAVQQFSLDMTCFESAGQYYVSWAANPGDFSNLYIASIDPEEPWQLTSECTKISMPDFAWENPINEGPAVIKNDGKVYLCYSAAAVNYTYCVGMLMADEGADLLDADSWTKYPVPLLSTYDFENQCGPGHNSFTVDENGNPVIVYHARPVYECSNGGNFEGATGSCDWPGNSLLDPCRHARVKSVNFAADGTPILNMTPEEELKAENKTVTVKITVSDKKVDYEVTDGDNGSWTPGTAGGYTFRISGTAADFTGISVNGETLDPSRYTLDKETMAVTIDSEYLDSLKAGEYTFTFVYKNGTASAALTVKENPQENPGEDPGENPGEKPEGNPGSGTGQQPAGSGSSGADSSSGDSGSGSAEEYSDVPQTGDSADFYRLAVICILAAAAAGSTVYIRRKL